VRVSQQRGGRAPLGPPARRRHGQRAARPQRPGAGLRRHAADHGAGMNASAESLRPASVIRLSSRTELNRQWLIAALARLRARIEAQIAGGAGETGKRADCVAAAEATGFTPALVHCAQAFGLSPFERELLLLAAGLELDHGLRAAITTLNSGVSSRASYGVALAVLTQPHWDALSPDAPLRHWRMVEPEPGGPLTQAGLRIDERILHFL